MTAFTLLAALGVLRVITAFVFANGIAALAVAAVAWAFMWRTDATWVAQLFQFSVKLAIVCVASAVVAWRLMPPAFRCRRSSTG